MPIELTESAAHRLREILERERLDAADTALRVDVDAGGPGRPGSGYTLEITATWSDATDVVMQSEHLRLVCRKASLAGIDGTVIDYREESGVSGFVCERPRQQRDAVAAEKEKPPHEDDVKAALRSVIDPEVGINILDLGLVYGVAVADRHATLRLTMTTPACPLSSQIKQDAESQILGQCPGVTGVTIEMVWDPPWTPQMMSSLAKQQMGWQSR